MYRPSSSLLRLLVVVAAAAVIACGPTELTTPSAQQAERIIGEQFPGASIRVREVNRSEQTLRGPAEFNEADVIFVLDAGAEQWEIAGVEQGGTTYTVDQLGEIAASMEVMRGLSNALEAFKADNGDYPSLDDLIGLGELVPAYYPADGSMSDAWGEPFRYRRQDEDYTITSTGPDRQAGSRDDILLITGHFVANDGA